MARIKKGEFTSKTKEVLERRAGGMCSMCYQITSIPHTDESGYLQLGEAAHVEGRSFQKNNRFNPNKSPDELSDISNGIWLCSNCHSLIDRDEQKYTVQTLLDLKSNHELQIRNGDLNYAKFKEYRRLEFELFYLREQVKKQSSKVYEVETKIERLEEEKKILVSKIVGFKKLTTQVGGESHSEASKLQERLNVILEKPELANTDLEHWVAAKFFDVNGDFDQAEFHYLESLKLADKHEVRFDLARLYYLNNNQKEATKHFNSIVSFGDHDPKDGERPMTDQLVGVFFGSAFYLASMALTRDQAKESIRILENARKMEFITNNLGFNLTVENKLDLLNLHACALWKDNQSEKAWDMFTEAFERADLNYLEADSKRYFQIVHNLIGIYLEADNYERVLYFSTKLFEKNLDDLPLGSKLDKVVSLGKIGLKIFKKGNLLKAYYITNKAIKLLHLLSEEASSNYVANDLVTVTCINFEIITNMPPSVGRVKTYFKHLTLLNSALKNVSKAETRKSQAFADKISELNDVVLNTIHHNQVKKS